MSSYCHLDVDIHDGWSDTGFSPTEWLQIVEPDGTVHEVHTVSMNMHAREPYTDVVEDDDGRMWKLVHFNTNHWVEVMDDPDFGTDVP